MLSLVVACEFPGFWQYRGLLAVPDRGLPAGLERFFRRCFFPIDDISRLQGMILKNNIVKRLLYQGMVIFNKSN